MRNDILNCRDFSARQWLPALAGACLLTFSSVPSAFGQTKNTNTATSPNPATNHITPNDNLPSGFAPPPQFVAGKVMMDDGSVPPGGVALQRVCHGTTHLEGYTDVKGGFGFEMGKNEVVQDASFNGQATINPNIPVVSSSDPGMDPNRPYRECEIRAEFPGYRSDSILLANYRPGENNNLGTIVLHKMGNVEGSVISANTAAAPKAATKEYEKGLDSVKKGKPEDAVQSFNKAIAAYPNFAAALFELGKLQMSLQQTVDAQKSFEAAIKAEPKFISPYVQLSEIAFKSKNWQMVADVTAQLLKLDAFDFPQQYYYNGLANYTLQRAEPAESSLRETIKLDTGNHYPKAHQFLAAILVAKKDYNGGAAELRAYLKLVPDAPDARTAQKQLAELAKISSETAGK